MKNIKSRPFSILGDCGKVYQFMLDIYERDWRNSVPAPFFEYAYASFAYWQDITYSYKNRIWEENGEIVAFCFYENPRCEILFSFKPGYEELASEMISYAEKCMCVDGYIKLRLIGNQTSLIEAAKKSGYHKTWESHEMIFDFQNALDYPLPDGFHFVEPQELNVDKIGKCCWKGFDHEEEEGEWNYQYNQSNYQLQVAPHATMELSVAVADENGEYACYAGMWWTPQNKLAYMEPLCTVPEHRHKGLAAAALSELYRRTKTLGATHMTGGENEFYKAIGYNSAVKWTYWEK